jgi:hypothetical protein
LAMYRLERRGSSDNPRLPRTIEVSLRAMNYRKSGMHTARRGAENSWRTLRVYPTQRVYKVVLQKSIHG